MGASFGRAEQEGNHVGDVLGNRRSVRPTGSPGKALGWAGNPGVSEVLRHLLPSSVRLLTGL